MAYVKVDLTEELVDGLLVAIKAPCDCTAVEGFRVYYPKNGEKQSKTFTMKDTHGNNLVGVGNLFLAGAYVSMILDTNTNTAYIQNADTNAYLENRIANAKPEVVDNLESHDTELPLSANQGRILNENFTGAANALGEVLVAYGMAIPDGTSLLEMIDMASAIINAAPEMVALIPKIDINSGLVIGSFNSTASNTYRYKAFDGDDSTWTIAPMNTKTVGQYIGFNFGKKVTFGKVKIKAANYSDMESTWDMKLQYSNDGSDWHDCSEETGITVTSTTPSEHEIVCTVPVECNYFRIYFTGGETYLNNATGGYVFRMHTIQAYGYDGSESGGGTVYLDGNEVEW